MKKLQPVDVSAYSNNAIRKHGGRFYMRSEVDEYLRSLESSARCESDTKCRDEGIDEPAS